MGTKKNILGFLMSRTSNWVVSNAYGFSGNSIVESTLNVENNAMDALRIFYPVHLKKWYIKPLIFFEK